MKPHSKQYEEYLRSSAWQEKRLAVLANNQGRCERCQTALATEVHHRTYERLGHELLCDLEALCDSCHEKADRERAAETVHRQERALADARFNGWASKVYGEDWEDRKDPEQVEEAFERWLERRGDE